MTSPAGQRLQLASLILTPDLATDPTCFDLDAYGDFLDALCVRRTYQADAIRAAVSFLLSGRYGSINDLLDQVWSDPAYGDLHAHYGDKADHQTLVSFPGKLAASIDLATATGKSYLLYGVARIALNEGVDVRRVLILVPTRVIREQLRDKVAALLSDARLNATLPPRPTAVRAPTLIEANETIGDGTICIENRDQVYPHVGSSIRPSFSAGGGADTLVLNDEAHHVYDAIDETKKDATGWCKFLADPEFGFRRILGVSGTCFTPRPAPYDYFADVLYRYSVRQAIADRHAKQVKNIANTSGAPLTASTGIYQQAIWTIHQRNRNKYGAYVKPLTIVVTQSIQAAKKAKDRFVAYIATHNDPNIEGKCLVVSSSAEDAPDRHALRDIEKPGSPHEYVFSVSMLTEGWDAEGVFQVVPYEERAFNSRLLIAQVLGRGLRMPTDPNCPTPIVRIFNHTAWAASVAQIVADIINGDDTVTLAAQETEHARHFTIDRLIEDVKTSRVLRPVDFAGGEVPDDLLTIGVALAQQRVREQARLVWTNTATGTSGGEDIITTASWPTVDAVAAEQYRQLRDESEGDHERRSAVERAGKSAVVAFINASMRMSRITGPASKVISPSNIPNIRAGLLACFPRTGRGGPAASVLSQTHMPARTWTLGEPVSTACLRARDVTANYLQDAKHHTVWTPASTAGFKHAEQQRFSELAVGANFTHLSDWELRCPTTFVTVSHSPEWHFLHELVHRDNVSLVTGWVKSPDNGFYAIRYTHSAGDKGGQTSDFNPDFILYDQRLEPRRSHIYLVEMKDEGDTSNQNRDKVNAADAYAKRLNEAVTDDRPTYSFHLLTPGDVLPFFTALREGTAESYVGMLHQILRSEPVEDTATEAASPVEAWTTDAWDD